MWQWDLGWTDADDAQLRTAVAETPAQPSHLAFWRVVHKRIGGPRSVDAVIYRAIRLGLCAKGAPARVGAPRLPAQAVDLAMQMRDHMSWPQIAASFQHHRIPHPRGQDWTVDSLRKAVERKKARDRGKT